MSGALSSALYLLLLSVSYSVREKLIFKACAQQKFVAHIFFIIFTYFTIYTKYGIIIWLIITKCVR